MVALDLVELVSINGEVAPGPHGACLPRQRPGNRSHCCPRHQGKRKPECHGVNFIGPIRHSGGGWPVLPHAKQAYLIITALHHACQPAATGQRSGGGWSCCDQALAAGLRSLAAWAARSAALASTDAWSGPNTLAQNRTAASTWD